MKIKTTIATFFFLFAVVHCSQAGTKPKLSQVLHHFFDQYSYDKDKFYLLKFAKKKTGWTVYELDPDETSKVKKEQLIWSQTKNGYVDVDYQKNYKHHENNYEKYLSSVSYDVYDFTCCSFYGYNGWDADVVKEFGDSKSLGDTSLESLARAYANLAESCLWNQYGYRSDSFIKTEWKFGDTVTDQRVNTFIKFADKDLETYLRLANQNADYETKVGNIYIKYSAENIWVYSTLYLINRPALAQKYLIENLFGPSWISMARNYLSSVKKDGIFIADGDLDTYSIWYLQESQGYRRDVSVINFSMLSLPVYANAVRKGFMHQPKINTTFDSMTLLKIEDYYYLESRDSFVKTKKLIEDVVVKRDSGEYFKRTEKDKKSNYLTINGGKFIILVDSENVKRDLSFPHNPYIRKDTIIFDLSSKSVIYSNSLILMDLVVENNWHRHIYFSNSSYDFAEGNSYLAWEPMVYHLVPFGLHEDVSNNCIDSESSYNLLMSAIVWESQGEKVPITSRGRINLTENLRSMYYQLASNYITRDKEKSKALIQKLFQLMPLETNPGRVQLINIATQSNDFGLSDTFAIKILVEGVKGLKIITSESMKDLDINDYSLYYYNQFKEARETAKRLNQMMMIKDIDAFVAKYNLNASKSTDD